MSVTISKKEKVYGPIIGLDISTKTGLALIEMNKYGEYQVQATAELTASNAAGNIGRADVIAEKVIHCIETHKPMSVFIEGYGYSNTHTLVVLVEIGTLIRHALYKRGLQYHEIPPTSLKKFVCGKGNAKKDMVMKEVFKRWAFEGTDNECDAVGLAMFGAAVHGKCNVPKGHMEAAISWRENHASEMQLIAN